VKSRGDAKGPVETAFEGRARRAELLAGESASTSAVAPLRFAGGLYRVQGAIAGAIQAQSATRPLTGSLARDADVVLREAPRLFQYVRESAPEALAKEALARNKDDASVARSRILVYWGTKLPLRETTFPGRSFAPMSRCSPRFRSVRTGCTEAAAVRFAAGRRGSALAAPTLEWTALDAF